MGANDTCFGGESENLGGEDAGDRKGGVGVSLDKEVSMGIEKQPDSSG